MAQQKKLLVNLSHFEPCSRANGPGKRAVVWVQGCTLGCSGCVNQHTWSQTPKELVNVDDLFARIMVKRDLIEGVTFSGGEPFLQAKALAELSQRLKKEKLSIVSFSGFSFNKLNGKTAPRSSQEFLAQIDLLIDGPYVQAQHTNRLPLRGSANQQLRFLTNRYSLQDIKCPEIEFKIDHNKTSLTGFVNNNQGNLVMKLLNAVIAV